MKLILIALSLVTGFSATTFFLKHSTTLPNFTNNSSTPNETVNVKASATVSPVQSQTNEASRVVLRAKVNKARVLYLNSEVTYASSQTLANQIKELNAKSSEPIWLLIDSPGGSVPDGATVVSEMEASKAPVYTVCTRLCASMAAMIHSYGTKRYALDRAILMYHPPSGGTQGQMPNMLSQVTFFYHYCDKLVNNIVSRSKVSRAEYDRLVAYEIWIDAEDAQARGLSDGVVNLNVSNVPEGGLISIGGEKATPETLPKRNFNVQMISPYLELWDHSSAR